MKLSEWAKLKGVTYRTAYQWFKDGLIKDVEQMETGTILVHEKLNHPLKSLICIYARVSSNERKNCLSGQIERCVQFANAKGLTIDKIYKEIGSGMNDKRPQLLKMINSSPTIIIVEYKDRLTRFGFNYLELLLNKLGCEIIVLNKDNGDESDLMKDLVSIITSFCYRLYGLRRGKNKAAKIKQEIEQLEQP